MATSKKLLQAAAGTAYGGAGGLNVEDVFSTYLYTGNNGSNRDISNGIDLSTEGGMVWWRPRDNTDGWGLIDTERGAGKNLRTHGTFSEYTDNGLISAFNTDGYRIGGPGGSYINSSSNNYVSFSFRKAPKFFDVVTYTGDGTSNRSISHDLNSNVGTIIVKSTSNVTNWMVWHKDLTTNYLLTLNSTAAQADYSTLTIHDVTSTSFQVDNYSMLNASGVTYVAYLFAHNDGDGDFGSTADQDIIKCGSINTSTDGTEVNLGWEPQFVIFKRSDTTSDWAVNDTMRGFGPGSWKLLRGNTTAAEAEIGTDFGVTSTGFICSGFGTGEYIYIAIRRGPMAVPTAGTDVFAIDTTGETSEPYLRSSFPVDMSLLRLNKSGTQDTRVGTRLLQGQRLETNNTDVEAATSVHQFDYMNGWLSGASTDAIAWMWKRAPSYFDVVAYSGTGVARTINHNLGAVPEMMWVKSRTNTRNWMVYHKDADASPESGMLRLDGTQAFATGTTTWNNTQPTASVFSVGTRNETNNASETFIAYLFASLDGVSKVGSYTGNSSTQNIDCGFSSGARFVLIKRTDDISDWFVFDTVRGIVTGAFDPYLELNTTQQNADAASGLGGNFIEPYSGGFALNNNSMTNGLNMEYIFYAIA